MHLGVTVEITEIQSPAQTSPPSPQKASTFHTDARPPTKAQAGWGMSGPKLTLVSIYYQLVAIVFYS